MDSDLSRLARDDANLFVSYVLKDDKGESVSQAAVHKEMQWHIDECRRREERYCGILAPWGHGKCFSEGTTINLADGRQIKIEEYREGQLFNGHGQAESPVWFGSVGRKRTYLICFSSGRRQVATYDHPFMTQRGWVKAEALMRGDKVKLVPPVHSCGKRIKNAWLAGLYIGDGSYGKISCGDPLILESLSNLGKVSYLGQYDYYLRGTGKLLRECGIHDRAKKILPAIRTWDLQSLAEFMAGWFDADSHVGIYPRYRVRKDGSRYQKARSYRIELYSINKDWLEEARYALLRLGIPSALRLKNGMYKSQRHISWRLTIEGKSNMRRFRDMVPMKSTKAKKLYDQAIDAAIPADSIYDFVSRSMFNGEKECWGFTMREGVHSIDGVVSHNTEQVVIARTLKFLGENRNNRIFPVCNTDDNSKARVEAIRRYIMMDPDYHRVFPEVAEANLGDWTKHKIVIERDSMSKDGSVESWGITSSGTGGRCDILIFDDPVDLRNAILNPASRQSVKDAFKNVWMSRLVPGGFAIYIATVWHDDDLTSEIMKNPAWKFLVMAISEDMSCIKCKSPFKGEYDIPLWEAWNKDALMSRRKVIGQRAFDRGFRQLALSDEDRTLPSYLSIFKYGLNPLDVVRRDWPRVGGMDPFGKFVVIFTLAVDPGTGKRYPLEIRRGKWGSTEAVNQLIDAYNTHRHQIIVVENNASQDAIVQWALEKGHASMPIMPFVTGKQKADPMIGLPGMEVEFANGSWLCAMGNSEHEPDCHCGFCVWKEEMGAHPIGAAADTVMASWFAREGARAITLGVQPQEETQREEIITQEDVGMERVKIGDY